MGDLAFVVFNVPPCKKKRVRGLTQPVIKREEILGWESPRTGPGVNELTRFQIPPNLPLMKPPLTGQGSGLSAEAGFPFSARMTPLLSVKKCRASGVCGVAETV